MLCWNDLTDMEGKYNLIGDIKHIRGRDLQTPD